jgi:hypothetical protein
MRCKSRLITTQPGLSISLVSPRRSTEVIEVWPAPDERVMAMSVSNVSPWWLRFKYHHIGWGITPTLISTRKKSLCSRSPSSQSHFFGAAHKVRYATTGDDFFIAKISSRSPFKISAIATHIPKDSRLVSVLQHLINHRSPFYFDVILSALSVSILCRFTRPLYKNKAMHLI